MEAGHGAYTHTHKVRSGLCFTPIKPKFSHTGVGGLGSGMGTLGLGSFNTSPKSPFVLQLSWG